MKFEKGDRVKLNSNWYGHDRLTQKNSNTPPYAPNGYPKKGMVYFVEEVYHKDGVPYGVSILGYPLYVNGDSEAISVYDIKLFDNLSILKRLQ
jgi:hypothetical protein